MAEEEFKWKRQDKSSLSLSYLGHYTHLLFIIVVMYLQSLLFNVLM